MGPKCTFGAKSDFRAKSAIWSKKSPLELSRTHIPLAQIASGAGRTPKSGFLLQKSLFGSKTHFGRKVHFWRQSALFAEKALLRPHAADAYKTNGILMEMEPLLVQKRFWAEKCILGSRIDLRAQIAGNDPKMHFCAQKCSFRKSDQKVNVRLNVPEREQGIPDSSPDSIHGRPGLLKHVAFSVPLHSNNGL